jgi:hypothetical protein
MDLALEGVQMPLTYRLDFANAAQKRMRGGLGWLSFTVVSTGTIARPARRFSA